MKIELKYLIVDRSEISQTSYSYFNILKVHSLNLLRSFRILLDFIPNISGVEQQWLKTQYSIFIDIKFSFDNFFLLSLITEESTNAFFNENWATLNQALQPIIQSAISEILLKYMRAIFHFIPANFFVSDIPTSKQLYGE